MCARHDNPALNTDQRDPNRPSRLSPAVAIRLAVAVITIVTVIAFAGTLDNDFVDWDDRQALVENQAYRGLTWPHLRWMFTSSLGGHYQPLSWLSFALESSLWGGVNAAGFHFTNLLLHVITCVGLFFVTVRLLEAAMPCRPKVHVVFGALLATMLFAVHPLRVESVAWATERRDVLSGAWLMFALLFYLRAVDRSRESGCRRLFVLSVTCYVMSLFSKAAGITLPVVLLILDMYPLRRVRRAADLSESEPLRQILLEKLLYLVPAIGVGLAALWAQSQAGALWRFAEHPLGLRIGQAFYGIMFYIWKTIWPGGLIPLYEQRPDAAALDAANVLSAFLVLGITIWCFALRRKIPALLTGWVVYITLLLPMIGFAQSGPQVVADRYSYLSCMPWVVLVGGGVVRLRGTAGWSKPAARAALLALFVLLTCGLVLLTRGQTRIWRNSTTLWTTVIERAPDTGLAHANLAVNLNAQRNFDSACEHARTALRILPGNRVGHIALARCSAELDDLESADTHYRIAIGIRPGDPQTIADLARVKVRLGQLDEAERLYRDLVVLQPSSHTAHFNLAGLLASQGRLAEGRAEFQHTLRLNPAFAEASLRLAVVLLELARPAEAIEVLEAGLRYSPDDAFLNGKLAWILATCRIDALRDGPRAVTLAERAIEGNPSAKRLAHEAFAASLAEVGRFEEAAVTLDRLLADESAALLGTTRERLNTQLNRYRGAEPVRD